MFIEFQFEKYFSKISPSWQNNKIDLSYPRIKKIVRWQLQRLVGCWSGIPPHENGPLPNHSTWWLGKTTGKARESKWYLHQHHFLHKLLLFNTNVLQSLDPWGAAWIHVEIRSQLSPFFWMHQNTITTEWLVHSIFSSASKCF